MGLSNFSGFVRRPGVFEWRVAFYDPGQDEDGDDDVGSLMFFDDYESLSAAGVGGDISPSFWLKFGIASVHANLSTGSRLRWILPRLD